MASLFARVESISLLPINHLLVKKSKVLVTKGTRENRTRPAIDPLFRSAAVTHTSRVIAIVLTGMLDDGTAGLLAIKKCGGITVVQDPNDAAYPGMPQNAVRNVKVDQNPVQMAGPARGRPRKKLDGLVLALRGNVEMHHRFMLEMQSRRVEDIEANIAVFDGKIDEATYRGASRASTAIHGTS